MEKKSRSVKDIVRDCMSTLRKVCPLCADVLVEEEECVMCATGFCEDCYGRYTLKGGEEEVVCNKCSDQYTSQEWAEMYD